MIRIHHPPLRRPANRQDETDQMADRDRFGVDVLTSILGSSFNGRLFVKVRENEGRAYTLGGDYIPGVDIGTIYFYVLTTHENIDFVKQMVKDEIVKLQTTPMSDQELQDMKNYMKGIYKAGLETNSSFGFVSSLDELYGFGYDFFKEYDKNIDQVDKDTVTRLAQKYLNFDQSVIVITSPINLKGKK